MRKTWIGEIALLMTVATIVSSSAQAQTAPTAPATTQETTRSDTLFEEGRAALKQQKWDVAEAKFKAAFALNPSYDVATNLGQTQYRLGKYREAAEHLAFALRSWPLSAKLDQRETASKRLAELQKMLARVTVTVSVAGAAVLVDEKEVGRAPLASELYVDPGARVIEAKLAGFEDAKQSIEAAKGAEQSVSLTLAPIPPQPSAPTGGPTGPKGGPNDNEERDKRGSLRPIVIGGLAATGVAVVLGVTFTIVANQRATDAESQRNAFLQDGVNKPCATPPLSSRCAEFESTLSSQQTFTNAAIASFVLGGALGAGTAIYALVTPTSTPKPKPDVKVAPAVSTNGGGLVVAGVW